MIDVDAFKRDLEEDLRSGREAFEGRYAAELSDLMGLSREEIDRITPDASDVLLYNKLIAVVKQASRHNLSQAQLVENIKSLGAVAVAIAKKTAGLASILT